MEKNKMICAGCKITIMEIDEGNPVKGIALCKGCMSKAMDIAKDTEKKGGDFFGGFFEEIEIDDSGSKKEFKV